MEGLAVVDVSRAEVEAQDEVVLVAGGVGNVGEAALVLALDEHPAVGIGFAAGFLDGLRHFVILIRERCFPVRLAVFRDLFVQFFLVLFHGLRHGDLLFAVAVCVGFDVRPVDEDGAGVDESRVHGFLENALEDMFEDVRVLEAADVVLPEGREMGDLLGEPVADEPAVSDVDFNLADGLTHAADAEKILDEDDLEERNGVDAGRPAIQRRIQVLDLVIDEAEIDSPVDDAQDVVLRNQVLQRNELDVPLTFTIFLAIQGKHPH